MMDGDYKADSKQVVTLRKKGISLPTWNIQADFFKGKSLS